MFDSHSGGFEAGSTLQYDALSTRIVSRSIALGTPVIHVAMNYRVSAFGFLASKEVQAEGLGNFGLNDQRVALRWVNKYIKSFGGDPKKVTIWGQSAGAISASLQMLAFGGKNEGLFRGAFMQSGAPVPVGNMAGGQKYYDKLVADAGCANAACGTLECLRTVPLATLQAAINKSPNYLSYEGLSLAWGPRVDGTFLTELPYNAVKKGKVANVPFVTGNVDDEGTLFSSAQGNVSTDADFKSYIKTVWLPKALEPELAPLWASYPDDSTKGSPFDTGSANQIYGQYKRVAAFQGDSAFQSPRRYFQQQLSGKTKMWTYLSKKLKTASAFGSYHGSDIDTALMDDYIINFTVNLNPNGASGNVWPQYSNASPNVYTFTDTAGPAVIPDKFRTDGFSALITLSSKYPS
ncbi:hypothetical protein D9619_008647 [Psilocybe cf. subviscida]|uniref:Carboxylic ester hydrolase n=1 Tax=Psilocybe cf. subviscida TaxID=2480587 RepID=A0A8H5F0S7_9AGAR|nr:hypothetical protein D9619_008647 [Psilocybe cf. subviscida]